MSAMPLSRRPAGLTLEHPVPPCCAFGLLWLGGGLLSLLLFPALRGAVAGWGWMPLFLVVMPMAVLMVSLFLRVGRPVMDARRVAPRRATPRHAARSRRPRSRLPQRRLVALLAGLGLHRG